MGSNMNIYTAAFLSGISFYHSQSVCDNQSVTVNQNSKNSADLNDEAEITRLRAAVKLGSGEAAYQLGMIYKKKFEESVEGYNLELEAIYYFKLAATYNHPQGTFEAGFILVEYDEIEGMALLQKAIALGSEEARVVYKNMKIALESGELSGC